MKSCLMQSSEKQTTQRSTEKIQNVCAVWQNPNHTSSPLIEFTAHVVTRIQSYFLVIPKKCFVNIDSMEIVLVFEKSNRVKQVIKILITLIYRLNE